MNKQFNPEGYWRKLPHYQPNDSVLFITFRSKEVLPLAFIKKLNAYKVEKAKLTKARSDYQNVKHKKIFDFYDSLLAKYPLKNNILTKPEIAQIITNVFHEFNKEFYDLFCFTIMPNHVHLLLRIKKRDNGEYHEMQFIIKKVKSVIAREVNKILGKSGSFWQREYFDYCARSEKEIMTITNYILMNPVKAGLVDLPEEWQWSWVYD
jgi:putative transposase